MDFVKPKVLPKHIIEIVDYYPLGDVLELKNMGGIPNTTYWVNTDSGEYSVRVYSHGQSSTEHIKLEMEILRYLANSELKSPHPIANEEGKYLSKWNSYWVTVCKFIHGETADEIPITQKLAQGVGQIIAQLMQNLRDFEPSTFLKNETFIERGKEVVADLEESLSGRGWEMDTGIVLPMWNEALDKYIELINEVSYGVVHADAWPPNIIFQNNKVTGIIDFDDWCFGAHVIDIAVPAMEFAMFQTDEIDKDILSSIFDGFFQNGGSLTSKERQLIIPIMIMCCCVWLVYNIVQAPTYEEAHVYLRKLRVLQDEENKHKIMSIVDSASKSNK